MATLAEVNAFIEKLSKLAIAERKKRDKWVLPSICIAQAALETGWGKSNLMVKANAYFGIKASKSWVGKVYDSKTSECYDGVNYVNITATFRAYDNVEESVADYFNLITKSSRYAGAVNNADALSAITAIKNGGYATSPTYIEKIMKIVNTYNLTQYDKVEETQATTKPTTTTVTQSKEKEEKKVTVELTQLSKGSTGEEVKTVQRLLKSMGYDIGKYGADGKFGNDTLTAVKKFQSDNQLTVDGIVGKNTWNALLK